MNNKIWSSEIKHIFALLFLQLSLYHCTEDSGSSAKEALLKDSRPRVIVSTDIGGTDPDDFQSMVHLLLYADTLAIEGMLSSPYGPGRKETILQVIDFYEQDYDILKTYSDKYPSPDSLRALTKQGATDTPGVTGVGAASEGSDWLIRCARCDDPRPLHVLVWGGIEDLAQALHDAPDILPKLRVYFIGGPNKKWSVNAYQYIATNHKDLWIIESNATYRGWFSGGNQSGEWGNSAFVSKYIAGHGALGSFFNTQLSGTIKMGDTPSVARLLHGDLEDPSQPSWGGQFVRAWPRSHVAFDRITTATDSIEQFGVLELNLPLGGGATDSLAGSMIIENQSLSGLVTADGRIKFLFSPKSPKKYFYRINSNDTTLDGKTGHITAYLPSAENEFSPDPNLPNWWTDDPSPDVAEKEHIGAKTVNRWREKFLSDFAARMQRCETRE